MMERYTEFEKLNDTPEIKFEKPSAEDRARFEAFCAKLERYLSEPFHDAKQLDHH